MYRQGQGGPPRIVAEVGLSLLLQAGLKRAAQGGRRRGGNDACEVEQATASPLMAIIGAFVGGAVGLFLAKDEMTEPELFRILLVACGCGTTPRRRWVLLVSVFGLAGPVLPGVASAQRPDDRAQFDARMNMLERSVAELSIQIEGLRVSDQGT